MYAAPRRAMLQWVFKREEAGGGFTGVACGKIKGGREVRIRLSQRMLELLSDFLARIMEHSLKKAFARDRDTRERRSLLSFCPLSHASTSLSLSPSLLRERVTGPLLSFAL